MQRLAAVAVSFWDHTQKHAECDWKKAVADERADPVETPVGSITEPATESQESTPVAQQEPASSSSGPAAPMPTQNFQNEQMDSPMELGPQERRERKGARPSNETPTSEVSGRPVVKARPASPPTTVPTAEGSGTVVLSTPASSSKDEMTIGGLIRDRWNRRCSNSRPRGRCVAAQKRAPPNPRCMTEIAVEMEVDESEIRSTPGKKIWSKWVETRKDPNNSAIRCRLCASEVNTGESRSDTFAAAPPLKFVRLILSWAASISVAFFHGKVRKVIYVVPPKNLRKKGKIWRLLKSLYGTRDASHVFATYLEVRLNDHGFQRNAVVP